ncbi:MAG: peptide ABC transporter substrate-binding protein [Planctomycetota bacterium]|nr:peptide ABC transporter substrate-binding protein [Planctomycetota bacterium]MDA1106627.1 peptide ABC transporter substrate-binding protein [Planctomycetota bacterium]
MAFAGFLAWRGGLTERPEIVVAAADPFTLDPQKMSWQQELRLGRALFETLVRPDPDTALPVAGVAERWEVSESGKTWTFHLRGNARWSDGSPVNAEDFREAWMRLMLPDMAADYSGFALEVDGANEFFAWRQGALADYAAAVASGELKPSHDNARRLWDDTRRAFDERVGLSCPDDRTLVVQLRRPIAYWLDLAGFVTMSPVHRPSLAAATTIDPATGALQVDPLWTKPGRIVSNGPLQLTDWAYQRRVRMEPNPHYWDRARVLPRSVETRSYEDNNTAVLAFESGAIDWIADVTVDYRADMAAEVRAGARTNLHVLPAFGTDYFQFNCRATLPDGRANPFVDPRVRRAFAMAVDKRILVENITRMHERVADSLTPEGAIPGYEPPPGLAFDPAAAKSLLAEAGWTDRDGDGVVQNEAGEPFQTVDILFSTSSTRYGAMALALRDMWRDALGVHVEVLGKDTKFFRDDLKRGQFLVARGGWFGDYGDPATFLELLRTGDGNNDRKYSSAVFDALLDQAAAETDPARRLSILREAEALVVQQDLPLLPICRFVNVFMYEPSRLDGISTHPRNEQDLARMSRRDASEAPAP